MSFVWERFNRTIPDLSNEKLLDEYDSRVSSFEHRIQMSRKDDGEADALRDEIIRRMNSKSTKTELCHTGGQGEQG